MSKTPIILLHGALGNAQTLAPLKARLEIDSPFAPRSIDFYGHGQTDANDRPYQIEAFAAQVSEAIYAHRAAPARIFGYSMGGYVALYLALTEPEIVHSVFTLGTKFDWNEKSAEKETRFLDAERLKEKNTKFYADLAAKHSDLPAVLAHTQGLMLALGKEPLLTEERLAALETRVRFGLGDRDEVTSLDETVRAYRAVKDGQLQVLPGTRHPLETVNVTRLAAALIDFWGE